MRKDIFLVYKEKKEDITQWNLNRWRETTLGTIANGLALWASELQRPSGKMWWNSKKGRDKEEERNFRLEQTSCWHPIYWIFQTHSLSELFLLFPPIVAHSPRNGIGRFAGWLVESLDCSTVTTYEEKNRTLVHEMGIQILAICGTGVKKW